MLLANDPMLEAEAEAWEADRRAEARVQWPDVLRALGRDQVRSYAIGRLKERGFTPALFADPSGAGPTRRAVLEALIQTEDWLELNRPKAPEREPLKALRRKLERECYP